MPLVPWIFDKFPHGGGKNRDKVAPLLSSAEVGDVAFNKVVLVYNELLDQKSIPANGDYVVTADAAPIAVTSISILNRTVTLTLASNVSLGEVVLLSYTAGTNKVRDGSWNNAANLVNQAVTNNTYTTTTTTTSTSSTSTSSTSTSSTSTSSTSTSSTTSTTTSAATTTAAPATTTTTTTTTIQALESESGSALLNEDGSELLPET